MKNILNFQLSVIGNYSDFTADIEKMNTISAEFEKSYLPTSQSYRNINLENGEIEYQQRLSIVNSRKNTNIICNPDRIDFNLNSDAGILVYSDPELKSLIENGLEDIKKFMRIFNLNGYRLAFNIYFISDRIEINKINEILKENRVILNYFKDRPFQEYLLRYNSTNNILISNSSELLNELVEVSFVTNQQINEKRVSIHFDLNTTQFNSIERFNSENLDDFYAHCEDLTFSLFKEFLDIL